MGKKSKKERVAARQAAEAKALTGSRTGLLVLITSLVFGIAIATEAPFTQSIRIFMNEQGVSLNLALPKLEGRVASTKLHRDFDSFYPFFLSQHTDNVCRVLHATGTSLVISVSLLHSKFVGTLLTFVCSFFVGTIVFASTLALPHGFLEFAAVLGTALMLSKVLGTTRRFLLTLCIGNGFTWVGHFFFEHNQPATFIYPTFSLAGEFKMWFEIMTGALPVDLGAAQQTIMARVNNALA